MNRPMTGIRGAGYTGAGPGTVAGGRKGLFDPLNSSAGGKSLAGGSVGSPAGLDGSAGTRREETPEDKIKALEKKINQLIEESCFANNRGKLQGLL